MRWGFALLGVVLVGLVSWGFLASQKPAKAKEPPPVAVNVAVVTVTDVPISVTALGAARAWQSVLVSAQVNGVLKFVAPEGEDVPAGALLAEIDPSPYLAALAQAQGAMHRDQALLAAAQVDLARYQGLVAEDSLPRQQVDTQAALVKQYEGAVQIDRGAVAAAQVNVGYCQIRSPISGRVGVRIVDPGNVVTTTSTTGIVSVNQVTPIAVVFTVPQGDFQRLWDASGGFTRPMATLALSQETGAPLGNGELTIADNHVDPSTGTVQLKARFPNEARKLWPGQFINVRLQIQTLSHVITVPSAAVNPGPHGPFVYVVGADGKVSASPVVVAATQDATAVIQSGLSLGQKVVTDGQMALRPGASVSIRRAQDGGV
jgi:multidrug efflux system membrane fusion protein